jgi:hypothetical protein
LGKSCDLFVGVFQKLRENRETLWYQNHVFLSDTLDQWEKTKDTRLSHFCSASVRTCL